MTEINEKRNNRRILAVCRALDDAGNFVGFTLDMTTTGVHIIVEKSFHPQSKFDLILSQNNTDEVTLPSVKLTLEQMWRKSTNEEYDQIGAKIIHTEQPDDLASLVAYCDQKAKEKYQFFLDLV